MNNKCNSRDEISCNILKKSKYDSECIIPDSNDYNKFNILNNIKYSVATLKTISKYYKLKKTGNKQELQLRIYYFLLNSYNATIIQKYVRLKFVKIYIKLLGPALFNRDICCNKNDFFTFENVNNIKYNQFFSYKGLDNTVWGFNILSIYNLFLNDKNNVLNPYTREKINNDLFFNIRNIINISKILNIQTEIVLNKEENIAITREKKIEMLSLEIFQHIDSLGNYTNHEWLLNLNRDSLIRFLYELIDIWQYRTQIEHNVKKQICPPYGNPFLDINFNNLKQIPFYLLQEKVLLIIKSITKKGINKEMCNLGASYILCSLTLVNHEAAFAMPWFYQSVSNIN